MSLGLVGIGVRALSVHLNKYYRTFRGVDPDTIDIWLQPGGRFAALHSVTRLPVVQITDAGLIATLADDAIETPMVEDGAITEAKLADGAVTSLKIANGGVATADLADGAVTSLKIADLGVATGDLADGAVSTPKIADGAVTSLKIADLGIATGDLADGAVTSLKIADGAVIAAKIPDGSITSAKIADLTIVDGDISASANISGSKLADGTVTSAKLAGGIPVPAGSITTTEIQNATILAADVAAGVLSRKNLLINGTMRVWQRGPAATFGNDNAYGPDRWRTLTEAANAALYTRTTNDWVNGGTRETVLMTVGAGNNNKFGLFQVLESQDVWHLKGGTVSLQVKAKPTGGGITNLRAAVLQWTGTEDAVAADPISAWNADGTNPTLLASWAYANTPVNLSPTVGVWGTYKIEGIPVSGAMANLAVFIWSDDKTTTNGADGLRVTDVQLEEGPTCTDFERRLFADDLQMCLRYYWKTQAYGITPQTSLGGSPMIQAACPSGAGGLAVAAISFPAAMRTVPSVTTYNPSTANANWSDNAAPGVFAQTNYGFAIQATPAAATRVTIEATAVAEL